MVGENAQILENTFQKLGNEFKETNNSEGLIAALKAEASKLSETKIRIYLKESMDEGYIGRAILFALNRVRAPKQNYIELSSDLHLEHIAPQTPTEVWKADLFNGDANQYSEYEQLVSEIGNLTLLDHKINTSIKQAPFTNPLEPAKSKSSEYKDSVIAMTSDLHALKKWDQAEVEKRTEYMIAMFDVVFSVEPSTDSVKPYEIWKRSALDV
jgi:hypothetical protein